MIRVLAWEVAEDGSEAIRDFEDGSSGLFAAIVAREEDIVGETTDPQHPWEWQATRHDDDDRDERRATDEEREWIRRGLAATREEGQRLADEVLRGEGYDLEGGA